MSKIKIKIIVPKVGNNFLGKSLGTPSNYHLIDNIHPKLLIGTISPKLLKHCQYTPNAIKKIKMTL
jgi:hypothetical protein